MGKVSLIVGLLVFNFVLQAHSMSCATAMTGELTNEKSLELSKKFQISMNEIDHVAIKQRYIVKRAFAALISSGHLVINGPPGGGKTTAVKSVAAAISGIFRRTQFTPDTTPTELTGQNIYDPISKTFVFHKGSIFGNVLMMDELNRAIPRTQSALFEGLDEGTATVDGVAHALEQVHIFLATMNPGTQIGTFSLPEAQLDRFLFQLNVTHADLETERLILEAQLKNKRDKAAGKTSKFENTLSLDEIMLARRAVLHVEMPTEVQEYLLRIIDATRNPIKYSAHLSRMIKEGISSRGTIGLEMASRSEAWLEGRLTVETRDLVSVAKDVLRHRLILRPEVLDEGTSVDSVIDEILKVTASKK